MYRRATFAQVISRPYMYARLRIACMFVGLSSRSMTACETADASLNGTMQPRPSASNSSGITVRR